MACVGDASCPPGSHLLLPTWTSVVFLVAGLFHPTTVAGCQVLLLCFGVVCCVVAAVVAWRIPHRSCMASWLLTKAMAAALIPNDASNKTAATCVLVLAVLVMSVSLLRVLLTIACVLFDGAMERDGVPLNTVWVHVLGGVGKTTHQFSATDEDLVVLASQRDIEDDLDTQPHLIPSSSSLEEMDTPNSDSATPIEVEAIKEDGSGSLSRESSSSTSLSLTPSDPSSLFSSSSEEMVGSAQSTSSSVSMGDL